MEIKELKSKHLIECADLLIATYNCEPWNFHWTKELAIRYLTEYFTSPRFVGFILVENDKILGATFGHNKTWWNNDELYIDELYIAPTYQRKGYGTILLNHLEKYIKERKLAGFTLLTNKYMPSVLFYEKNGVIKGEHILFMYKVV